MLAEFFEWWIRQWLTLLPLRSKLSFGRQLSGLTIGLPSANDYRDGPMEIGGIGPETVTLPFDDKNLAMLRALPGAKRSPLRLILPAGTVLERKVSLPLAVAHDLSQVLRYEMNRLTPFAAADVFWDWTVVSQDKRLGKLDIRLRLAKRAVIAPILDVLRGHELYPDYLESCGAQADSSVRRIRLQQEMAPRASRSPVRIAAFAVCGLLAIALVATPFIRHAIEISAVGQQIAALQPSVATAASLRRAIEGDAQSNIILHTERGLDGDPLQVLAAVTDALPDGTWLTDFTLQQRVLHLGGESHGAAQLIGKLAGSGLIGNPAFAAPVTSNADRHTDVFSISAEIRP